MVKYIRLIGRTTVILYSAELVDIDSTLFKKCLGAVLTLLLVAKLVAI